jgi:hypothetical protein
MESDPSDQGKYECVASNSVGTEYSKSTTLYVKSKLRIFSPNSYHWNKKYLKAN